jgi:glucose/arabinose dehydrogenase
MMYGRCFWSLALFLAVLPTGSLVAGNGFVRLEKFSSGFSRPVAVIFNPVVESEAFVVEQGGYIRSLRAGKISKKPVLDLSGVVNASGSETGLLGMALHPGFAKNGRVFLNYTTAQRPRTIVSEFKMSTDGTLIRASERVVLEIAQPFSNHNGGDLKFGPDGFLYIGTGDGGSANDPQRHGQNLSSLLGKMLRIDVDKAKPYAVPADNPKFAEVGARPEIFAYGLRNPWRYSFDRTTGKLWAGDVGQNAQEEIDIIEKGANYGWNRMEGTQCLRAKSCDMKGLTMPVHVYPRSDGVSVTGGYVYRGGKIPALKGMYLFADYVSGNIWGLVQNGMNAAHVLLLQTSHNISSFGEDREGELYAVDHSGGAIYRIVKGK